MNGYSIIVTLAAAFAVGLTSSSQPANTTPDATVEQLDADGLPPRIDYAGDLSHSCDGTRAVDVIPDTEQARAAADRWCLRADLLLRRVDWPAGLHPITAATGH